MSCAGPCSSPLFSPPALSVAPSCSVPRIQCIVLSVTLPSLVCSSARVQDRAAQVELSPVLSVRVGRLPRSTPCLSHPLVCETHPASPPHPSLFSGLPLGVCLRLIRCSPEPVLPASLTACTPASHAPCLVTVNFSHASFRPSAAPPVYWAPPAAPGPLPPLPRPDLVSPDRGRTGAS